MSHAYHEGLPHYNPDALLHDGCPECEERAAEGIGAINSMDWRRGRCAVERAVAYNRGDLERPVTDASEARFLNALWNVLVWLQRETEIDPIDGEMPWKDMEALERRVFGR